MRNPKSSTGQSEFDTHDISAGDLRRMMYERIANGHALASADEVARQDNRHSRKHSRK